MLNLPTLAECYIIYFCSSDEEENEKENAEPCVSKYSSPKGDPVKAFVDDEAEEEDDSDNDRMRFGDDEEDEDDDDTEELNKMIAIGYKERSVDLETRNELHQKWLEEKDAAGTDDLLRRLNVTSKLKEASLIDDEEGEDDVELTDDVEEDVERPRASRIDSKRAKELIAQMFTDKDEEKYLSSDDEETEKILVRERKLKKVVSYFFYSFWDFFGGNFDLHYILFLLDKIRKLAEKEMGQMGRL